MNQDGPGLHCLFLEGAIQEHILEPETELESGCVLACIAFARLWDRQKGRGKKEERRGREREQEGNKGRGREKDDITFSMSFSYFLDKH